MVGLAGHAGGRVADGLVVGWAVVGWVPMGGFWRPAAAVA